MKYIIFFMFMLLSLSGCGGHGNKVNNKTEQLSSSNIQSQVSTLATSNTGIENNKTTEKLETPLKNKQLEIEKVITIYIHGYDQVGYKKDGIYGSDNSLDDNAKVASFMGFSTLYEQSNSAIGNNILVSTQYYGNKAPDYYTQQDIKDIENAGIGIPRYALIIAKYAKHIMKEKSAKKINFLSASMGSLVTRYMIEKNLENLASDKKIAKWLSMEGVIQGNYAASKKNLVKLVNIFEKQSPDVKQMSYTWIEKNLGTRNIGESPYYKDILIGFETSTKDDALDSLLSTWLVLNDKFRPNDGYQVARDTYFRIDNKENMFHSLPPTHTYFHDNHIELAKNKAAWAQAISFLTSKKRVKITLTKATINDIHEKKLKIGIISHDFKPAEIVFSSNIISPILNDLWSIKDPIDERVLSGGALPIYKYKNSGETQIINQELFNDFINPKEDLLTLNINAYEIDRDIKYNMHEITGKKIENLGADRLDIPIKNGSYPISAKDWEAEVKVEVFEY